MNDTHVIVVGKNSWPACENLERELCASAFHPSKTQKGHRKWAASLWCPFFEFFARWPLILSDDNTDSYHSCLSQRNSLNRSFAAVPPSGGLPTPQTISGEAANTKEHTSDTQGNAARKTKARGKPAANPGARTPNSADAWPT